MISTIFTWNNEEVGIQISVMLERRVPGPASHSLFSCSESWPEITKIGTKQAPEHPSGSPDEETERSSESNSDLNDKVISNPTVPSDHSPSSQSPEMI